MINLMSRPRLLTTIIISICIVVFPIIFSGGFLLGAGILVGIMAISGMGFVLLLGYAHQIAVGHTAFSLIGGYCSAILTTRLGMDPFIAMVIGIIMSSAIAYAIAKPMIRLRFLILAMGSLAFQFSLTFLALEWVELTGGADGTMGVPKFAIFGLKMTSDRLYYFWVWLLVAMSVFIGHNIDNSKMGRALKAVGNDAIAAESSAMNSIGIRVQIYVLSAALMSISGSLMTHYLRLMEPHVFGFTYSLNLITAVIIGGLTSIWAGVIGCTFIVVLRQGLKELGFPAFEVIIIGVLTVVVLIYFRRGLVGFVTAIYTRRREKKGRAKPGSYESLDVSGPVFSGAETFALKEPDHDSQEYDNSNFLYLDGVSKYFGNLKAVENVNFGVQKGTITSLIGPNGAGKTTLFNCISGHLPLDGGVVSYEGGSIEKLHPHQIAHMGIARTFQNLRLYHNLTVLENVMCGRHRISKQNLPAILLHTPGIKRDEKELLAAAYYFLEFVGLEKYVDALPDEVSFGHQRLVEIARALALDPKLLLMDEPASGLNDAETESLAELLFKIRQQGTTIFLVEHDIRLIMGVSDYVQVMQSGKNLAHGTTEEVRKDPKVIAAYIGGEV